LSNARRKDDLKNAEKAIATVRAALRGNHAYPVGESTWAAIEQVVNELEARMTLDDVHQAAMAAVLNE
jgi:hypothetical protein